MCVLPELCSQGGHLLLLTSSVCIITRLPWLGSRCYESARVTNDHGIALGTHTHVDAQTQHTQAESESPYLIPKRDVGCLCLSVIQWVSARCLARFSLGGTESIHSPDNRPAIHSRGWEKLSAEQGRVNQKKKHYTGCVQYSVQLTGTSTEHTTKEKKYSNAQVQTQINTEVSWIFGDNSGLLT